MSSRLAPIPIPRRSGDTYALATYPDSRRIPPGFGTFSTDSNDMHPISEPSSDSATAVTQRSEASVSSSQFPKALRKDSHSCFG